MHGSHSHKALISKFLARSDQNIGTFLSMGFRKCFNGKPS